MQGMEKTIPELYSMLKSAEVEIKKEHQVLMVNKTTSFKKGKGKKNFKKDDKAVAAPGKPDTGKKKKKWTQAWDWVLLLQGKRSLEAELPQILSGQEGRQR